MDDDVYMKVKTGKRSKYVRVGRFFDRDHISDGVWLFEHYKGGRTISNISTRLQSLPCPHELEKYIKAFMTKEILTKAICKLKEEKDVQIYNISLDEFSQSIVDEMYIKSKERK